jgi:anti-sigma-K factor RskA
MSGSDGLDAPDDGAAPDMIAAEYVLGTLDAAETLAAESRIAAMPDFAAEVRFWETRLMPLTALVDPVPPPASLWPRIEDTTGGAAQGGATSPGTAPRAANDNRLVLWRGTAFAAMAVAAGLAAFIAIRPIGAPSPVYAVLTPAGSTAPVLLAMADRHGDIFVRPTGAIQLAADKDMELWSLPAGAKRPASLGVLPAGGKLVTQAVATGTQLLVSVEPKGGSPTGQPTGPVVYGGILQRID